VKFGTGEQTFGSLFRAQISRLSGQRVAPVARKTHFWTSVSKNNTGMAALRAGLLPVTKQTKQQSATVLFV